jgi:hypothetical protein
MPRALPLPLLALLLLPLSARADRGELYTLLELSPSASRLAAPSTSAGPAWKLLPAGKVLVLRGLTHELLVGGALGVAYGKDLLFQDAAIELTDGSSPRGRLYEDLLGLSLGAAAAYRYDTGYPVAPVLRAELGLAGRFFHKRTFLPANTTVQIAEPSLTEWTPYSHVALGAELRFADKWVGALGLGATRYFHGRAPWQVGGFLVIGRIWW